MDVSQHSVELCDVSFRRQGRLVLDRINLKVKRAEAVCILGPNGCGKTTLLNNINGTLKVTSGRIRLRGEDIRLISIRKLSRIVGTIFQEHHTVFAYPVVEVVVMGRNPYIGPFRSPSLSDYEKAEMALQTVGIEHLRSRPYDELSGGERQLVLIARALAQNTDIILMDEPTSHLDLANQMKVLRIVRKLVDEQTISIIFTTHYPGHAVCASRVALMKNGRFSEVGSPQETIREDSLTDLYGTDVGLIRGTDYDPFTPTYVVPVHPGGQSNE